MPVATTFIDETQRFDLETCPGGFIVLRRLTYGEHMKKKSMTTMSIAAGMSNKKDVKGTLELANEEVTVFEFSRCIVDHNLEDAGERKLNLSSVVDIQKLNPRIGQEIEKYLDQMNSLDEDDENSPLER